METQDTQKILDEYLDFASETADIHFSAFTRSREMGDLKLWLTWKSVADAVEDMKKMDGFSGTRSQVEYLSTVMSLKSLGESLGKLTPALHDKFGDDFADAYHRGLAISELVESYTQFHDDKAESYIEFFSGQ